MSLLKHAGRPASWVLVGTLLGCGNSNTSDVPTSGSAASSATAGIGESASADVGLAGAWAAADGSSLLVEFRPVGPEFEGRGRVLDYDRYWRTFPVKNDGERERICFEKTRYTGHLMFDAVRPLGPGVWRGLAIEPAGTIYECGERYKSTPVDLTLARDGALLVRSAMGYPVGRDLRPRVFTRTKPPVLDELWGKEVVESARWLQRLDEMLVSSDRPVAPLAADDPFRCVTSLDLNTDFALAAALSARESFDKLAIAQRTDGMLRRRNLDARIDPGWQKRIQPASNAGCSFEAMAEGCVSSGAPPSPALFLYAQNIDAPAPPTLMARMEAAKIAVPERFACLVRSIRTDVSTLEICDPPEADTPAACVRAKKVLVPLSAVTCSVPFGDAPILRVSGELPELHKGDVVSVPVAGASFHEGVVAKVRHDVYDKAWFVWAVRAESSALRVDGPANCPTADVRKEAVKAIASRIAVRPTVETASSWSPPERPCFAQATCNLPADCNRPIPDGCGGYLTCGCD